MPFDPSKLPPIKQDPSFLEKAADLFTEPLATTIPAVKEAIEGAASLPTVQKGMRLGGSVLTNGLTDYLLNRAYGNDENAKNAAAGGFLAGSSEAVSPALIAQAATLGTGAPATVANAAIGLQGAHDVISDKTTPAQKVMGAVQALGGGAGALGGALHFFKPTETLTPEEAAYWAKGKRLDQAADALISKRGTIAGQLPDYSPENIRPNSDATASRPVGLRVGKGATVTPTDKVELAQQAAVANDIARRPSGPIANKVLPAKGIRSSGIKNPNAGGVTPSGVPIPKNEYIPRPISVSDMEAADQLATDTLQQEARQADAVERAKGAPTQIVQDELINKKPILDLIEKAHNGPLSPDEQAQIDTELKAYPKGVVANAWKDFQAYKKGLQKDMTTASNTLSANVNALSRSQKADAAQAQRDFAGALKNKYAGMDAFDKARQARLSAADRATVSTLNNDLANASDAKRAESKLQTDYATAQTAAANHDQTIRRGIAALQAAEDKAKQQAELDSRLGGQWSQGQPRRNLSGIDPETGAPITATDRLIKSNQGDTGGGGSNGGPTTPLPKPVGKIFKSEAAAKAGMKAAGADGYVPVEGGWRLIYKGEGHLNAEDWAAAHQPMHQLSEDEKNGVGQLLAQARANGYTGDANVLGNALADHLNMLRDTQEYVDEAGANPEKLLSEWRKAGGIVSGSKGDAADIEQVIKDNAAKPGQATYGANKKNWVGLIKKSGKGLTPDGMLEHLQQSGFPHLKTQGDLRDALERALLAEPAETPLSQLQYLAGNNPKNWWERFVPPSDKLAEPLPSGKADLSEGEKAGMDSLETLRDALADGEAPTVGNGTIPVDKFAEALAGEGDKPVVPMPTQGLTLTPPPTPTPTERSLLDAIAAAGEGEPPAPPKPKEIPRGIIPFITGGKGLDEPIPDFLSDAVDKAAAETKAEDAAAKAAGNKRGTRPAQGSRKARFGPTKTSKASEVKKGKK